MRQRQPSEQLGHSSAHGLLLEDAACLLVYEHEGATLGYDVLGVTAAAAAAAV